MVTKNILVTGATGHQGKAFISSIRPTSTTGESQDYNVDSFHILALTRNPNSPAAKSLATEGHVTVIQGNLDQPPSMKKVFEDAKASGGVWGVFCVLKFPGLGANADGEETQGKLLADLALEYGCSEFVFSSVERGGVKDDDKAILDRLAKIRIEHHLRELGSRGLPWTILRPGFFMENFQGVIGSVTAGVLKAGLKPDTAVQLVAVNDIGRVAAAVFQDPTAYKSAVLIVAGETSTVSEQEQAYRKATGKSRPSVSGVVARTLIKLNGHTKGLIADMERVHKNITGECKEEYDEACAATRGACPDLTSYETWVGQQHQKPDKAEQKKNWNEVSVSRLITGKQ